MSPFGFKVTIHMTKINPYLHNYKHIMCCIQVHYVDVFQRKWWIDKSLMLALSKSAWQITDESAMMMLGWIL